MMITDFDLLDFEDVNFLGFALGESRIEIIIENLRVLTALHPQVSEGQQLACAKLAFEGVTRSRRLITEYLGSRRDNNFKSSYLIEDGPFPPAKVATVNYRLKGVQQNPLAWVDWDIESAGFVLITDDMKSG